jgi:hypothetical protein
MRRFAGVVFSFALIVGGCGTGTPSATSGICDGVPAEMGGCEADQPTFAADTCDGMAIEFGDQYDRRALHVIDGPAIQDGQSRASQLTALNALMATRALIHLSGLRPAKTCNVDAFITELETRLSSGLKSRIGDFVYDGTTRPYAEWRANLRQVLTVLGPQGSGDPGQPASA